MGVKFFKTFENIRKDLGESFQVTKIAKNQAK